MINFFDLENYKSYQVARLPLAALTMLIGANAAGKSNAIEGLRFLSWLALGNRLSSVPSVLQGPDRLLRGRIHELGFHGRPDFAFSSGISIDLSDGPMELLQIKIKMIIKDDDCLHVNHEELMQYSTKIPYYQVVQAASGMGTDLQVAYNNYAKGGQKPRITCSDQFAIFTQLDSPSKFHSRHRESQTRIPRLTETFRTWLSHILFLDPSPSRMRDYSFKSDKRLFGDGRNLSSVLFDLWGGHKDQLAPEEQQNREEILKFVRSLPEQDIDALDFLTGPRDEVMVKLVETFGGIRQEYDASLLSDGTLRVLAIAAAMLSAPENGMVVIEEIDNGVHPSRAALLLEQINCLAEKRKLRVLLSSHNPALLDALPDRAVPDVVFCYRDPVGGASSLVRLQDLPDYPSLLAQGRVGHLMTTGLLERFVKYHPGSEQKKQLALDWLQQLQKKVEEVP